MFFAWQVELHEALVEMERQTVSARAREKNDEKCTKAPPMPKRRQEETAKSQPRHCIELHNLKKKVIVRNSSMKQLIVVHVFALTLL